MKRLIVILLLMASANAYCGEDLTLVCKGVTTTIAKGTLDELKTSDTKTYIFKNGELKYIFPVIVCNWSEIGIYCKSPSTKLFISIDRISGVLFERNVRESSMEIFRGNCIPAKPKF